MTKEEKLQQGIREKRFIEIVYHGGSQPGTFRRIAPISIKNGKLMARCYASKAVKAFVIEKIDLIEGPKEAPLPVWNPEAKPEIRYENLEDLIREGPVLVDMGWHVASGEDFISLHLYFKNGKPRKGATVSLVYDEINYDVVFDGEEIQETNQRKRRQPWILRGGDFPTRMFGTIDRAGRAFMELARQLAPEKSAADKNG